jgi:hypothetical protein
MLAACGRRFALALAGPMRAEDAVICALGSSTPAWVLPAASLIATFAAAPTAVAGFGCGLLAAIDSPARRNVPHGAGGTPWRGFRA